MREHVMLVVRAYNDIVRDIRPDEKKLFIDHMRRLDRHVGQGKRSFVTVEYSLLDTNGHRLTALSLFSVGITKLTWQAKNMIEMYVRDCVNNCQEVHNIVKEFKQCKIFVRNECDAMQKMALLNIEKNQAYEAGIFQSRQKEHRNKMCRKYEHHFTNIINTLRSISKNFLQGSAEVQREWKIQVNQVHFRLLIAKCLC
jgi:hypothetical protein